MIFQYFSAENRAALRDLEGLEKLVDFVGNKVRVTSKPRPLQ